MLKLGFAVSFSVDAHRIARAALDELERADGHSTEAPEPKRRAAPRVGEAVETILQERERREHAPALQALDDLLVEDGVDLTQRLLGTLTIVGADEGEARGGEGPEALEAVVLRGGHG